MKKLFFLASLALVAVGCHSFKTETYSDEVEYIASEDSLSALFLRVNVEYPVKGLDGDLLDLLNRDIAALAFDLEDESGTVEESGIRYRDNLLDEYISEYASVNEEAGERLSWEVEVNGYFTEKYRQYRSYALSLYDWRGGNGNHNTLTFMVFDTETGDLISEADLFQDGYEQAVVDAISAHLYDGLAEEDQMEILEPESLIPNGNFEVSATGITWFYQPYEVTAGVYGVVSVSVPWEDLKGWLR